MAVVDIIKDGETTFIYHDDACKDKSAEEIKKALESVTKLAWSQVCASLQRDMVEK